MSFADNIKRIKDLRNKTSADLERDLGISKQKQHNWESGLNEPRKEILKRLAEYFTIPKELLLKENLTDADITGSNQENMGEHRVAEDIYRDLVEANTEYRLVPKTVLDGEYRMMLKSEIDSKEKMLWQVIESKNYAIAQLEREISELRSGQRAGVHPQKAS